MHFSHRLLSWYKSRPRDRRNITLRDLMEKLDCMAEQIINFGARANAALDKIGTAVDNVAADVAGLKAKIEELQNSPGAITPEDQKILDDIEARVNTLADHVTVLDEATPNVPPVGEGEVPPV